MCVVGWQGTGLRGVKEANEGHNTNTETDSQLYKSGGWPRHAGGTHTGCSRMIMVRHTTWGKCAWREQAHVQYRQSHMQVRKTGRHTGRGESVHGAVWCKPVNLHHKTCIYAYITIHIPTLHTHVNFIAAISIFRFSSYALICLIIRRNSIQQRWGVLTYVHVAALYQYP